MHKEIEKFTQKAKEYKEALQLAPDSRIPEIIPIIAILDGIARKLGIPKKELKIVDLMAGNGYLTSLLYEIGFVNITSIEACNEMSFDSEIFQKTSLYPIPDISVAPHLIRSIDPDVIVSLAAFHHLIEYDGGGKISIPKSIKFQNKIICDCMDAMNDRGIMIIADLSDIQQDINVKTIDDLGIWDGVSLADITIYKSNISKWIDNNDGKGGMEGYKIAVNRKYYVDDNFNFSLNWFRKIIDTKTEIGHSDIAISEDLIKSVSEAHDVFYEKYQCPWVFESLELLKKFIFKKFGFNVNEKKPISTSECFSFAKQLDGINEQRDTKTFGWDLGLFVIIKKNALFSKKSIEKNVQFMLVGICIVLSLLLIAKVGLAKVYFDIGFVFQTLLGFFFGGLATYLLGRDNN